MKFKRASPVYPLRNDPLPGTIDRTLEDILPKGYDLQATLDRAMVYDLATKIADSSWKVTTHNQVPRDAIDVVFTYGHKAHVACLPRSLWAKAGKARIKEVVAQRLTQTAEEFEAFLTRAPEAPSERPEESKGSLSPPTVPTPENAASQPAREDVVIEGLKTIINYTHNYTYKYVDNAGTNNWWQVSPNDITYTADPRLQAEANTTCGYIKFSARYGYGH